MWELAEKNQKVRDHDGPYLGCIECSEESRPPGQLTSVPAAKESAFHKAIFHGSSLARIPKKWPAVLISRFCSPLPMDIPVLARGASGESISIAVLGAKPRHLTKR